MHDGIAISLQKEVQDTGPFVIFMCLDIKR